MNSIPSGTSRDEFLARIHSAASAGRAYRVHLRDDLPPNAGYEGAGDDLCGRMALEVEAVGGQALLVSDDAAARMGISRLLDEYQPRSALCWQHPLLDRLQVDELLLSRSIKPWRYVDLKPFAHEQQRSQMFAGDLGITSATYAVAESGTLVMASGPGRERLASLLPPVHIAIIEESQILSDLFDLFERLQAEGLHNLATNIALITGPSKTGDIELQLTTGVHGPGRWHVIIIRRQHPLH